MDNANLFNVVTLQTLFVVVIILVFVVSVMKRNTRKSFNQPDYSNRSPEANSGLDDDAVKRFLRNQRKETHKLIESMKGDESANAKIWLLRRRYLTIEETAYHLMDSPEEHRKELESRLALFAKLIFKKVSNDKENYWRQRAKLFEEKLERIAHIKPSKTSKLKESQLLAESVNESIRVQESTVDHMILNADRIKEEAASTQAKDHAVKLNKTIKELKAQLKVSHERGQRLDSDLKNLQKKYETRRKSKSGDNDETLIIYSSNSESNKKSDDVNQIRETISQVDGIVDYQKKIISELESEVDKLRKELISLASSDTSDENQEKIRRLTQTLKETETCITILEQEMDTLRGQLKDINHDLDDSHDEDVTEEFNSDTSSLEVESLRSELAESEIQRKILDSLMRFSTSYTQLRNLNDLSRLLADILGQHDFLFAFRIHGEGENLSVYNQKHFTEGSNLAFKKHSFGDPLTATNDGFIASNDLISLMVGISGSNLNHNEAEDFVKKLINVTRSFVIALENTNKVKKIESSLYQLKTKTKSSVNSVRIQYNYQNEETTKVLNRLTREVSSTAETINATEKQKEVFNKILDESRQRINLLFAGGSTIDSTIKNIITEIDEL